MPHHLIHRLLRQQPREGSPVFLHDGCAQLVEPHFEASVVEGLPVVALPPDDEDDGHEGEVGHEGEGHAEGVEGLDADPEGSRADERDVAADRVDAAPARTPVLVVQAQVGESHPGNDHVQHGEPGAFLVEVLDEVRHLQEKG